MSWDNDSGKEPQPASSSKQWAELTDAEKTAVVALGYSQLSWDYPWPAAAEKYFADLSAAEQAAAAISQIVGLQGTALGTTHLFAIAAVVLVIAASTIWIAPRPPKDAPLRSLIPSMDNQYWPTGQPGFIATTPSVH